jgi:hypothetical protein
MDSSVNINNTQISLQYEISVGVSRTENLVTINYSCYDYLLFWLLLLLPLLFYD